MSHKSINIGSVRMLFVLRHKWEKDPSLPLFDRWRDYRLGLWYTKRKSVGVKNFSNPKDWSKNLKSTYTLGVELILVTIWVEISKGVMHIKLK